MVLKRIKTNESTEERHAKTENNQVDTKLDWNSAMAVRWIDEALEDNKASRKICKNS